MSGSALSFFPATGSAAFDSHAEARAGNTRTTVLGKIRAYLAENFLLDRSSSLSDSDSLLMNGVLDSTGVMEVILFLETEFRIQIVDEDLVVDNFDTVEKIASFLGRKTGATDL